MNFTILLDAGLPFGPAAGLEHHPPKPRLLFKMPRVVANQKEKFETDDLMKRHSREGEVSHSKRKKAAATTSYYYQIQVPKVEIIYLDYPSQILPRKKEPERSIFQS